MLAAPVVEPAPIEVRPGISRRRLLLAWGYDLATLLLVMAVSGLVAVVWMLARTDRGRLDLGTGDAFIALALALASAPAWTAWQCGHLLDARSTAGYQRMRALAPGPAPSRLASGSTRRTAAWLALHPVSLPFWFWLTLLCFATGTWVFAALAIVPFAALLLVGLLAGVSIVLLLARPSARPVHVWIAGTSFGGGR